MVASLASASAEAALWIRGDHACMHWSWLLPGRLGTIWPSFAPGLSISVVTHINPGSTAQRKRWDFHPGHVKLENLRSALFSLHLSRELQLEVSPDISWLGTQSPTHWVIVPMRWVTRWSHILGQALCGHQMLGRRRPPENINWSQGIWDSLTCHKEVGQV